MSAIATGTALLISAGVTAATAGATLGYEASQSGPTAPSAAATEQQQAEAATASAQAQAEALQKRRGMSSTILTSPMGTTGSASVKKSTLG